MKQFKVVLKDGRNEFVVAEDWILLEDRYLFTTDGKPRGDTFFLSEHVIGVYVEQEDYSPPYEGI
jgi:hypothetical protein